MSMFDWVNDPSVQHMSYGERAEKLDEIIRAAFRPPEKTAEMRRQLEELRRRAEDGAAPPAPRA
jgi:hypothetical protein